MKNTDCRSKSLRLLSLILAVMLILTSLSIPTDVSAAASEIKLQKKTMTLFVSESTKVPIKSPNKAKELKKVSYSSSNKKVATVSKSGTLNAKKTGKANITAKYKGKKVTLKLTVKKKAKNPKLTLKSKKTTLYIGGTYSIKVKKIKGVSTKKVVYSSSKKSIAKVSSKGKVTALKEGTATITVKSAVNKKVKAKFNVTVKKKDNGTVQPSNPEHVYSDTFIVDKEATCTEDGEKSRHCVYHNSATDRVDITKIPATGHRIVEGVCSACGYKESSVSVKPSISGLVDGGEYLVGTSILAPASSSLTVNGEMVQLKNGEYTFEEEGTYTVVSTNSEGVEVSITISVALNVKTDSSFLKEGYTYPLNQAVSVKEGESLSINGSSVPSGEYIFSVEGTYLVEVTDASGNSSVTTIKIRHTHDYSIESSAKAASCEENGYIEYSCSVCDESYRQTISALGHSFSDWSVITNKTCTENGVKTRYCVNCDYAEAEEIPTQGHSWGSDYTVDIEPTCTQDGKKSIHCTVCNEVKDETVMSALGHKFGEWVLIESAGCTNDGLRQRVCGTCGYIESQNLDLNGHDWQEDYTVDKSATCVEDGVKSIHCKNCDAVKDVTTVPAGHSYDEWEEVKVRDCTHSGIREKVCSGCGNVVSEYLPALGHTWNSEYTVDKAATCISSGVKSIRCSVCDDVKERVVIPATDHYYVSTVVKEATCSSDGETRFACSNCDSSYSQYTKKLGHDYVGGSCTICGKSEGSVTHVLGLVNGKTYKVGTSVVVPEDSNLHINGVDAELTVGTYVFKEGGQYTVNLDGKEVTITISSNPQLTIDSLVDGYIYPLNQIVSVEIGETLYIDDVEVISGMLPYTFSEEGEHIVKVKRLNGDRVTRNITIQHTHSFLSNVTVEPTCTTNGVMTYSCSVCGETFEEGIESKGHTFTNWKDISFPSCQASGAKERHCTKCNLVEYSGISETGHSWQSDFTIDIPATCTTLGRKSIHCTKCDAVKNVSDVSVTGHRYTQWVVTRPATCTEPGSTKRTCTVCGEEKRDVVPANGHTWSEGYITDREATCEDAGEKSLHCLVCNVRKNITSISPLGHRYSGWSVTVEPKCQESGMQQRTCSRCHRTETNTLLSLGHNFNLFSIDEPATCITPGKKSKHCSRCEATSENTIIAATGHSYGNWIVSNSSSCTVGGGRKKICFTCGYELSEVSQPTGHIWESEYTTDFAPTCEAPGMMSIHCSKCMDKKDTKEIEPLGHSYTEFVKTKEPTCSAPGELTRTCIRCQGTDTEEIEPLGHVWNEDFTVDIEPNCAEDGEKSRHCIAEDCDAKCDITVIPKYGHMWGPEIVESVADCVNPGKTYMECQVEGCSFKSIAETPPLGHTYTNYEVVKENTCTEDGRAESVCSTCGDNLVEVITKLGHAYNDVIEILEAVTCKKPGKEIRGCSNACCIEKSVNDAGEEVITYLETQEFVLPSPGHSFFSQLTDTLCVKCEYCDFFTNNDFLREITDVNGNSLAFTNVSTTQKSEVVERDENGSLGFGLETVNGRIDFVDTLTFDTPISEIVVKAKLKDSDYVVIEDHEDLWEVIVKGTSYFNSVYFDAVSEGATWSIGSTEVSTEITDDGNNTEYYVLTVKLTSSAPVSNVTLTSSYKPVYSLQCRHYFDENTLSDFEIVCSICGKYTGHVKLEETPESDGSGVSPSDPSPSPVPVYTIYESETEGALRGYNSLVELQTFIKNNTDATGEVSGVTSHTTVEDLSNGSWLNGVSSTAKEIIVTVPNGGYVVDSTGIPDELRAKTVVYLPEDVIVNKDALDGFKQVFYYGPYDIVNVFGADVAEDGSCNWNMVEDHSITPTS